MPLQLRLQEVITYVARIGTGLCACGQPGVKTVIIGSPGATRQVPLCETHYARAWSGSAELKKLDPTP